MDETSGQRRVILHPQNLKREKRGTGGETCAGSGLFQEGRYYYLPLFPSPLTADFLTDFSLSGKSFCVSEQARFHSSPAPYFISPRKKEMSERERERRTNQLERPDKCNKPKVYFNAPTKWVLRYCITLFI